MAHTPADPNASNQDFCTHRPLTRRAFAGFSAAAFAGLAAVPAQAEALTLRELGGFVRELLNPAQQAPAAQAETSRPSLLQSIAGKTYEPAVPAVAPYAAAEDFSNVININDLYLNDM